MRVSSGRIAVAVGLAALALFYRWSEEVGHRPADSDAGRIERLHAAQRSGEMVEATGTVVKTLPDDERGSRHQRFVLRLASGHTLLMSHNIDLAPRIGDLARGDVVAFRGQYEWNERGGVVHWTHRDPRGERAGGWLRHGDRTYR